MDTPQELKDFVNQVMSDRQDWISPGWKLYELVKEENKAKFTLMIDLITKLCPAEIYPVNLISGMAIQSYFAVGEDEDVQEGLVQQQLNKSLTELVKLATHLRELNEKK